MGSDGHFCDSHFQEKMELATNAQSVRFYRYEDMHFISSFYSPFVPLFLFYNIFILHELCAQCLDHIHPPLSQICFLFSCRPKPTWEGKDLFQLKVHSPSLKKPREELEVDTKEGGGEAAYWLASPVFLHLPIQPRATCLVVVLPTRVTRKMLHRHTHRQITLTKAVPQWSFAVPR